MMKHQRTCSYTMIPDACWHQTGCSAPLAHSASHLSGNSMRFIVIAIAAVLLTGCASNSKMVYSKLGNNAQDFKRDQYDCMQQSRTPWSGGGSGLLGLAMIAGSSQSAQDSANKTFQMCMEARGYTGRVAQPGEQAGERIGAFCTEQYKTVGIDPIRSKTFFPPITAATPTMLADDSKVTAEHKAAILVWGDARQKCREYSVKEFASGGYPEPLAGMLKATFINGDANIVRLYRGEVTWGKYNLQRNELIAEQIKAQADIGALLAQGTADAQQRAIQMASEQQRVATEQLRALTLPPSAQVGCTSHQLGVTTVSDCTTIESASPPAPAVPPPPAALAQPAPTHYAKPSQPVVASAIGATGAVSNISKPREEPKKLIGSATAPKLISTDETVEDPAAFAPEKRLQHEQEMRRTQQISPTPSIKQGQLPPCPGSYNAATWTNCVGEVTWPSGDKYVGTFKGGKRSGQGTYTFPSGQKYVGEFSDGKLQGQGTYTFPSGQKYVGEFSDGKGNGQGAEIRADGTILRSGLWANGGFVSGR